MLNSSKTNMGRLFAECLQAPIMVCLYDQTKIMIVIFKNYLKIVFKTHALEKNQNTLIKIKISWAISSPTGPKS